MEISKRNCFIFWNFSSSRYICFMFLCFCPYIILSLLLLCLCVCVCVWLADAPTYFTVNYILSNYLCKSFNFYKRVLATRKSRLVLRQRGSCCCCFLREKLFSKPWHEVAKPVRARWYHAQLHSHGCLAWPAPIHNAAGAGSGAGAGAGARSCRVGLLKTHWSSEVTSPH